MDIKGLSSIFKGRAKPATAERRWDHCQGCTFLKKNSKCAKCGCFMKLKVQFKQAFCPIGIWNKEE